MRLLQWYCLGLALCFSFFGQASGDEYLWQKQDTAWVLTQNGQEIGRCFPESHPTLATEDRVERLHAGVFRMTRVARNNLRTRWLADPGTINDWLVAWPGAFRLESMRRHQTWNRLR